MHKAGFTELQVQGFVQASNEAARPFKDVELAGKPLLVLARPGVFDCTALVRIVADDLAEVDAAQKVLVGCWDLQQRRIRPHVLDVGLNQRCTILDYLDHLGLARDCLVDQGVLRRRELARGQIVFRLLLAEQGNSCVRLCGTHGKHACEKTRDARLS